MTLATSGCETRAWWGKTKDKGMLREKDELTVSASREVRECELRCRETVIRVRERER